MSHPRVQRSRLGSTHTLPASLASWTADDFRALGSSVSWREESEADRIIEEDADWERRQREWNMQRMRESWRRAP